MAGFEQVVGHKKVIRHLQNAIENKTVGHAYLFSGADGAGKNLVAKLFAMTVFCEAGGTEPCGTCRSCMQVQSGNHPDVFRVTHEKNIISVDDIRSQLCGPIDIVPYQGPKKLFLVDEAEKMNEQAQNALLKTLEEPPEYAVIVLLANNDEAFLPTIRSRVVRLSFLPAPHGEVVRLLIREKHLPDYRAGLVAALAGDYPGRALTLSDSKESEERKNQVVALMKSLRNLGAEKRIELARTMAAEHKTDLDEYLDLMLVWVRDLLYYKAERKRARLMFREEQDTIAAESEYYTFETLKSFTEEIERLREKAKQNVNLEPSVWVMLEHMSNQADPMR